MRIISLASGSKGNATVVEHDGVSILIDCGLNYKTLTAKLKEASSPKGDATFLSREKNAFTLPKGDATFLSREKESPAAFLGVLITHSHTDHTSGLKPLLNKHPELTVYANAMTAETVCADCKLDENLFAYFENGQPFEIGPFEISAFSIPHDTSDPVGYLIRAGGEAYFHGTDIGTPLDSIGVKLHEADYATLESNHAPVMLHASGRPPSVIQRIAGPRGHLSNDQSADLVRRFASPKLKRLGLAHLSRDCNVAHIAEGTMRMALAEINRTDVALRVFSQNRVVEL